MQLFHPTEIDYSSTFSFFTERVPCAPLRAAQGYVENRLNPDTLLAAHFGATYFIEVSSESKSGAGIGDGELLVIDRSLSAHHGDLVMVDGFTVKEPRTHPDLQLLTHNHNYSLITFQKTEVLEIFSVVIFLIKAHK